MLAALGGHYHWSEAALLGLDDERAVFWHSAAAELHERIAQRRED